MTESRAQARRVARYYRWLDRLSWFDERRRVDEVEVHPVHRALRMPDSNNASPHRVHDMIAALPLPAAPRALDAGCGYGASMIYLAPRLGGRWTGVTLSDVQRQRGMRAVAAAGLTDRVEILVRSYDDPLDGPFDLIFGIESLIHSADPGATIRHLAAKLAPGGHLVVIDDIMPDAAKPEDQARIATFRRCWRCPAAPSHAAWRAMLEGAGLVIAQDEDLTPLTLARGRAELDPKIAAVARRSALFRRIGFGVRAEAEIGGYVLETLLDERIVSYRFLAARRS